MRGQYKARRRRSKLNDATDFKERVKHIIQKLLQRPKEVPEKATPRRPIYEKEGRGYNASEGNSSAGRRVAGGERTRMIGRRPQRLRVERQLYITRERDDNLNSLGKRSPTCVQNEREEVSDASDRKSEVEAATIS